MSTESFPIEHDELFRRFIRQAVVARKMSMRELLEDAGVAHDAVRYSKSPRFMTVVCLLTALREREEFTPAEQYMFLGCIGMTEEVSIEQVDLASASAQLMKAENRAQYWRRRYGVLSA